MHLQGFLGRDARGARAEGRGKLAVVSQQALILQREEWKRNGKRVVCAAGAFDLLHPGHVRLLEQARGLGDVLVVGVEMDEAVREREGRILAATSAKSANGGGQKLPVNPAAERAEVVAAIGVVDSVALIEVPLETSMPDHGDDFVVFATLGADLVQISFHASGGTDGS